MANIVITSSKDTIEVSTGDYFPDDFDFSKGVWQKARITFLLKTNHIEAIVDNQGTWYVSHDGNSISVNTAQIDTINGDAPSSLSDLYDKLEAIINQNDKNNTATINTKTSSATSQTLLAENIGRLGAIIHNNADKTLYIKYGTTASSSDYTEVLYTNSSHYIKTYDGRVDGIWEASPTGSAQVTEIVK